MGMLWCLAFTRYYSNNCVFFYVNINKKLYFIMGNCAFCKNNFCYVKLCDLQIHVAHGQSELKKPFVGICLVWGFIEVFNFTKHSMIYFRVRLFHGFGNSMITRSDLINEYSFLLLVSKFSTIYLLVAFLRGIFSYQNLKKQS